MYEKELEEMKKSLDALSDEVKKDLSNKMEELDKNVQWRLERIRASHAQAINTKDKKNKYFAYFLRVCEIGVLLCILAKLFS